MRSACARKLWTLASSGVMYQSASGRVACAPRVGPNVTHDVTTSAKTTTSDEAERGMADGMDVSSRHAQVARRSYACIVQPAMHHQENGDVAESSVLGCDVADRAHGDRGPQGRDRGAPDGATRTPCERHARCID